MEEGREPVTSSGADDISAVKSCLRKDRGVGRAWVCRALGAGVHLAGADGLCEAEEAGEARTRVCTSCDPPAQSPQLVH